MRGRTFVLFPRGASPNSPRKTLHKMLWSAIPPGSACHADAVYEKGDKGEARGED